jgi:23S rRNA (uracil1939-C5)-methyltransferase
MGKRTMGAPRAQRLLSDLYIESVDLEGQGVAHADGKVFFVSGALTGERVDVDVMREQPRYAKAKAVQWHRESADRVKPRCPHFGVCGGCSMQHASNEAQIAIKQRALEDALWHIGQIKPQTILSPLRGPSFGYRSRARLSVRWVDKKNQLLIGFRERGTWHVALMDSCEVLLPQVSALLPHFNALISSLSVVRDIPQLEVAVGDHTQVYVMRHLAPLTEDDLEKCRAFERTWGVQLWLQPKGPATAAPISPNGAQLTYALPEFDLSMPFSPVDFTQVNFAINRVLVKRAIDLLDVRPTDRVADFFCGLGNFSLALARRANQVVGIEGSQALTDQAMANARVHGLGDRMSFSKLDLFRVDRAWLDSLGSFDRVLIDPPREGAQALSEGLAEQSLDGQGPGRIVMVSCNPATLARDAAILAHKGRYQLSQAGVVNMFPQTAHVESIAVFDRLPPAN